MAKIQSENKSSKLLFPPSRFLANRVLASGATTRWLTRGMLPSLLRFYALFFISIYKELFSSEFRLFTPKRLIVLFVSFWFFPLLMIWNHLGFLLDDLLYPAWWHAKLPSTPIFIVGNARSGTTWLHRTLTLKEEKPPNADHDDSDASSFTTMQTWEIVFAPSVTWRRLFMHLYRLDREYTHSLVYQTIVVVDSFLFSSVKVHPLGLFEAEEDEWIMMHIGLAQLIQFLFPTGGVLMGPLVDFDKQVDQQLRIEIFDYYKWVVFFKKNITIVIHQIYRKWVTLFVQIIRDCIKRHYYARQCYSKTFVSKNPAFTMRIAALYHTFPDCKVVCMLRDPVESVPSMVSYISKVWHLTASPTFTYPNASDLLQFCIDHYKYPLEKFVSSSDSSSSQTRALQPSQYSFVHYRDLKNDLTRTVTDLFARLDMSSLVASDGFMKLLRNEQLKTKSFVSTHQHSVTKCCGMSEQQLRHELAEVYSYHSFDSWYTHTHTHTDKNMH